VDQNLLAAPDTVVLLIWHASDVITGIHLDIF